MALKITDEIYSRGWRRCMLCNSLVTEIFCPNCHKQTRGRTRSGKSKTRRLANLVRY